MAAGNLASHFGKVTAEPVVDYAPGQVNNYTATIYLGSTYNEPLPAAFLNDVLSTTHPVIWAGDNVWQLTGTEGSSRRHRLQGRVRLGPVPRPTSTPPTTLATVTYKGQTFSRNAANGAGILAPHITTPSAVTVLARPTAPTPSGHRVACAPIAQTTGTSFPWAIRSANLTYVGEIPFSYISESDRYVAFSDLLFAALEPTATPVPPGPGPAGGRQTRQRTRPRSGSSPTTCTASTCRSASGSSPSTLDPNGYLQRRHAVNGHTRPGPGRRYRR